MIRALVRQWPRLGSGALGRPRNPTTGASRRTERLANAARGCALTPFRQAVLTRQQRMLVVAHRAEEKAYRPRDKPAADLGAQGERRMWLTWSFAAAGLFGRGLDPS